MINQHAQKLGVKHGYRTHFRLVGVSARSRSSQHSHVTSFYEPYPLGLRLPGALPLATARRRDVIRGRDTHRSRDPCRTRLRVGYTAGCAASNMLPGRYADALSGTASPGPARALPGPDGMSARPGGRAVVQRSVHDRASLQYQRTSAHAWPPSGTSRPSGSAMPHMEH